MLIEIVMQGHKKFDYNILNLCILNFLISRFSCNVVDNETFFVQMIYNNNIFEKKLLIR